MYPIKKHQGSLDAIEAQNALAAESFTKLPDDIPLWRFREVLIKLGPALGLSGGAVVYALDLIGLVTEADWRGDGRAVTYHSLRTYARKVGKSERTICTYERQLIAAGLAHRTVKHARRHNGMGNEARRTGLDWRAFGTRMPELLIVLEKRKGEEQHRLDLEARIRASRRIVQGLIEALAEREKQDALAAIQQEYTQADVARLRNTMTITDLQHRLTIVTLLQDRLATLLNPETVVDNPDRSSQITIQSEDSDRLIDDTDIHSCPTDIRKGFMKTHRSSNAHINAKPKPDYCLEDNRAIRIAAHRSDDAFRTDRLNPVSDALPSLIEIWKAAPTSWRQALGLNVDISWPILIDLAEHIAAKLNVSKQAWHSAITTLGPREAAIALIVLDRNRSHPTRPVNSVGGALVGMTRKAEEGAFNLAPSVYGILARNKYGERSIHAN